MIAAHTHTHTHTHRNRSSVIYPFESKNRFIN